MALRVAEVLATRKLPATLSGAQVYRLYAGNVDWSGRAKHTVADISGPFSFAFQSRLLEGTARVATDMPPAAQFGHTAMLAHGLVVLVLGELAGPGKHGVATTAGHIHGSVAGSTWPLVAGPVAAVHSTGEQLAAHLATRGNRVRALCPWHAADFTQKLLATRTVCDHVRTAGTDVAFLFPRMA